MRCAQCGGDTDVIDSRPHDDGRLIKRRRRCRVDPQHRFSTTEFAGDPLVLIQAIEMLRKAFT